MKVLCDELVEVLVAGISVFANGQDVDENLSNLGYGDVTMMLILVDSFS
jgi:hypothetical protein